MQRRIPMGYRILFGKVMIDPEHSDVVTEIYEKYLNGSSTNQIAKELMIKGVLNASGNVSWHHGSVGRILENRRYLGDDCYPQMIDAQLFEAVQKRRGVQSQQLNRGIQQNCSDRKSVFTGKILCGSCGGGYQRYLEHTRRPEKKVRWQCKRSLRWNDGDCKNHYLEEIELVRRFIETMNRMLSGEISWQCRRQSVNTGQSYQLLKLAERIQELESSGVYSASEMAGLIFERARVEYQRSQTDDWDYQNQKMDNLISGRGPLADFEAEYFKALIRQVVIGEDRVLRFHFINGLEVPAKSELCQKEGI